MAVVVAVQGQSGSGKTTLIERLIPRLAARGLRVGVIKHAHDGFALDVKGKDSWRMWQAGAQAVVVASPQEVFTRERRSWSRLSELLGLLPHELDCVLIEGFTHTLTAVDVPVSLTVETAPEGVRLNDRLTHVDDAVPVVVAAVVSQLKSDQPVAELGGYDNTERGQTPQGRQFSEQDLTPRGSDLTGG